MEKFLHNLWCFVTFDSVLLQNHFFLAIYAVLLQNLFCRDLLAFAWRDIEPKIVPVEKK